MFLKLIAAVFIGNIAFLALLCIAAYFAPDEEEIYSEDIFGNEIFEGYKSDKHHSKDKT